MRLIRKQLYFSVFAGDAKNLPFTIGRAGAMRRVAEAFIR